MLSMIEQLSLSVSNQAIDIMARLMERCVIIITIIIILVVAID